MPSLQQFIPSRKAKGSELEPSNKEETSARLARSSLMASDPMENLRIIVRFDDRNIGLPWPASRSWSVVREALARQVRMKDAKLAQSIELDHFELRDKGNVSIATNSWPDMAEPTPQNPLIELRLVIHKPSETQERRDAARAEAARSREDARIWDANAAAREQAAARREEEAQARDRRAATREEGAVDRDAAAVRREQAASTNALAAEQRERDAQNREHLLLRREEAALAREQAAERRDRDTEARDQAAQAREANAQAREAAAQQRAREAEAQHETLMQLCQLSSRIQREVVVRSRRDRAWLEFFAAKSPLPCLRPKEEVN